MTDPCRIFGCVDENVGECAAVGLPGSVTNVTYHKIKTNSSCTGSETDLGTVPLAGGTQDLRGCVQLASEQAGSCAGRFFWMDSATSSCKCLSSGTCTKDERNDAPSTCLYQISEMRDATGKLV